MRKDRQVPRWRSQRSEAKRLADELMTEFCARPVSWLREQAMAGEGNSGPLIFEREGSTTGMRYRCYVSLASLPQKHATLLSVFVFAAPSLEPLGVRGRLRRFGALTRRHGLLWLRPVHRIQRL
jgi:hypothetical protein